MQPYTGGEIDSTQSTPSQPSYVSQAVPAVSLLEDVRNLILIALGWTLALVILPPQHEYAIIDDWIYAGSVRNLLDTGTFVMPQQSQANLIGLTYWGAGWSKLFGFSFTTLTYSTLFFSFVALF